MLLNQAFSLREAPRALFWIGVFLISFFGMFYLGLNPELIEKWYLVLVLFNLVMSGVAFFYIMLSMKKLKQNTQEGVIGSRLSRVRTSMHSNLSFVAIWIKHNSGK